MNRHDSFRLILAALAAALGAGCGGGGSDPPQGVEQAAAVNTASRKMNVAPLAGDTERPLITLTSPANLAVDLTGTVVVTATASDNVGVESVVFQVDGAQVGLPDTTPPYSAAVKLNLYPAGQHVIRARASDAAGNFSLYSTVTVQVGGTRSVPSGFTRNTTWVTGLSNATAFAQLPDGRLLVAQQAGALRMIANGVLLATPFAQLAVISNGDRGLIGVTPHPNFAVNGYVYVHYTTNVGGAHNRISRLTADLAAGGNTVVAGSELVLVDLPTVISAKNNGGAIHFGGDGKLYVAVGDNLRSQLAQDLTQPFGKMLRFNDDGSIPPDNPFFGTQTGLARAIWAYGLRNPFTFAVQPGSGRIHINDVGENAWEEINLGAAGANYGWPGSEGPDNVTAGITGPLFPYAHGEAVPPGSGPGGFFFGYAIVGGAFYPTGNAAGSFPPNYRSNYYFADYARQFVGRIDLLRSNAAYAFATLSGAPVDLLAGSDGPLYVLTRAGVTRISFP